MLGNSLMRCENCGNFSVPKISVLFFCVFPPFKQMNRVSRSIGFQQNLALTGPSTSHIFKYGEYDFPGQHRIKAKFPGAVGGGRKVRKSSLQ